MLSLAQSESTGYNLLPMISIAEKYQQTLDYLFSFVDFSLAHNLQYSPDKFNLERMRLFAGALGDPHTRYPVIHIAGTKGKGSVAALCASALQAAGYKVGLYTSPHLDDFTERIQVNGKTIPHEALISRVDELKPLIASIPELTTFEITTGLAFDHFARQGVNVAVIEVGLGGRLDSTNIVTPLVSVITSISYDHTQVLGDTLAKIAFEKAGIIKPRVPVIAYPQNDEARQVLEQVSLEHGCPLIQVERQFTPQVLHSSLQGQTIQLTPQSAAAQSTAPITLSIPLLGQHQVWNAATAYTTLKTAAEYGLAIHDQAIQAGFAQVNWPGRFEVLQLDHPVVLDCAHNRDSVLKLRQTLDEYFPDWPVVLLFGASEDKDIQGMFAELLPRVRELIAVKSFHPRAIDPGVLQQLAQPYHLPVSVIPEIVDAFAAARLTAGKDALILVTGSIFVVAAVRIEWHKQHK
jgi:dihydrofolate synthase/folylpolyglutamate synthase